MFKPVLTVDDEGWTNQLCGNKAYTLYQLFRAGVVNVPRLLVVTWPTLRDVFKVAEIDLYSRSEPSAELLEQVRNRTVGVDLTGLPVANEIGRALDGVARSHNDKVVTRSSSASEDSIEAAFPGVFDSFCVDNTLRDVLTAIVSVYSSRLSRRAISYAQLLRSNRKLQVDLIQPMAVLVQRHVKSKLGGVVFTTDPSGPADGRIDVAIGGAEPIVMGNQPNLSMSFNPYDSARRDDLESLGSLVGSTELAQSIEADLRKAALHAIKVLRSPVDIEWVWDGAQVWIVQARPILVSKKP